MTGFHTSKSEDAGRGAVEATDSAADATDAVAAQETGDEPNGPFKAIPSGLHHHLRPFFTDIREEVVRAIKTEIPEYARPTDDTYMQVVQRGVEHALQGFLERMAQPDTDWEPVKETYRRIGRGEADEGRSLDSFQSALRLGARVTWRRINALVDAELLPRNVLAAFGEALFLHLDEMAAATTSGYTEARLHRAGELQQRRARLLDLLTADPPAVGRGDQRARAHRGVAGAEGAGGGRDRPRAAARGGGPAHRAAGVPRPVRRRSRPSSSSPIRRGRGGRGRSPGRCTGYVRRWGPPWRCTRAPGRCAGRPRRWSWCGGASCPIRRWCAARSTWPRSCSSGTRRWWTRWPNAALSPLERMRSPQRERLAETLLTWLQSGHNASEVAARLAVHPQTVRYRMRQLDELFGERLHDPTAQFEMQLALRALTLRRASRAR